jgi:alanyl-tRNA synthetase
MIAMDCAEIRQKFVEYYQNLGFQLLPRAPMLHPSIPMSFVMSAGLVQVETSFYLTEIGKIS